MKFSLVALAALSLSALAAPSSHKLKESVPVPRGWTKGARAPADHVIELRIGLEQANFAELERHLYEVSDPDHERYGAHLSKAEVDQLVAPRPESTHVVEEWLEAHGFVGSALSKSDANDWITIIVPVSVAEKMLDTEYHVYAHTDGDAIVRTTSYSLPTNVHGHIDVIQPTTMFGRFKKFSSTLHFGDNVEENLGLKQAPGASILANGQNVDASCNTTITLSCLEQVYNIHYKPKATKKNQIGITGYLEEFANEHDLQLFYADQRPEALNTSFKFVSVKGGINSQNLSESGTEAALDVQFAYGLTFPTPGTFYSTAGRPPFNPDAGTPTNTNEPYADWLDYILSQPKPPQSISTSYGDGEQTVPEAYARRVCAGFAQLGARGVSLFFSSGDGGVGDGNADPATQQCFTNDGRNITQFEPLFPASCPYVTAVGGTNFIPETAVFFSGGGFSNYFKQPAYQKRTIDAYLKTFPKGVYKGLFNRGGRAYPDIAALGRRYRISVAGAFILIGGTSASSPTFASVVSLLNDARLAKGLPVLGFLNPLIYSGKLTSGWNDITVGNNPGCGTTGFNASTGWDPVTGFGTPNFGKLVKLVT